MKSLYEKAVRFTYCLLLLLKFRICATIFIARKRNDMMNIAICDNDKTFRDLLEKQIKRYLLCLSAFKLYC